MSIITYNRNIVLYEKLQVIACINSHDSAWKTKPIFPGGTNSVFLHFMKENFSEGLANPQAIDLYFTTRKYLEEIYLCHILLVFCWVKTSHNSVLTQLHGIVHQRLSQWSVSHLNPESVSIPVYCHVPRDFKNNEGV